MIRLCKNTLPHNKKIRKGNNRMKKTIQNAFIHIMCTAAIFLIIILFFRLMMRFIQFGNSIGYTPDSSLEVVDEQILAPVSFVCFSIAFYTFSYIFLYYDQFLKKTFVPGKGAFFSRAKRVTATPLFWIELSIILLLLFFLPTDFLKISKHFKIVSYPVFIALFFFAWTTIIRRLNYEEEKRIVSSKERSKKIQAKSVLKAICGRMIICLCAAFMAPTIGALLYTIFQVFTLFSISFIIALLSLIPLVFVIRLLRAIKIRKKMMKRMNQICQEKQFTIECQKVYRSILFANAKPEIIIRTGKTTIECKLLCALSPKTPILLSPTGEAYVVHSFKIGKFTLFKYMINTNYSFESNNKKVLILVPISRDVYGKSTNGMNAMFSGDKINDYSIYRSSSFLDALMDDDIV